MLLIQIWIQSALSDRARTFGKTRTLSPSFEALRRVLASVGWVDDRVASGVFARTLGQC